MKNWKSSLFVVLLVVFMLVCGIMLGNIDFSFNNDSENLNNSVMNDSEEFMSLFVGKYNYEKVYEDIDCKDYMNLEINSDGTYTYSSGGNCSSGADAQGKYAISNDKIYLFNDNCNISNVDGECMYVNCTSVYEFDYIIIDGKVKISVGGVELEKE